MSGPRAASITHHGKAPGRLFCLLFCLLAAMAQADQAADRASFSRAWEAARSGPRATFEQLGPGLQDYLLYPYWQYEDLRQRRAQVPPGEMAAFLDAHAQWAFAEPLRNAWLKSLGEKGRWQALASHGEGVTQAELQCYLARAKLATGKLEGLREEAERLWAVGRSQPDACDPLFSWLVKEHGIDADLAWRRVRLAFEAGNPRLTLYLARFVPPGERSWLERWQQLNRDRYRGLERAASWPDNPRTRQISAISLQRLAHHDADEAWRVFQRLDGHFAWGDQLRGETLREIALMAAVALSENGLDILHAVPQSARDDQLLQWWLRFALARQDWTEVLVAAGQMSEAEIATDRWQYWRAHAWQAQGERQSAEAAFRALAGQATYYGFLAADRLGEPYSICPLEPAVSGEEVAALRDQGDFARALELRAVGLDNWALAEWTGATRRLAKERLKIAAALAHEVGWEDRAIYALGDGGELRYYDWRFPVLWRQQVEAEAGRNRLDPAWVYGVMRAESAMTETARSSAGALGLMQVTPGTARGIAGRHGLSYHDQSQLLDGDFNIRFGTVYLRELLDRFRQNPVLVSGAYNAGPHAVERWLASRLQDDASIWIETLPYYETRDYIPRVLAFSTIYAWRLDERVPRLSARMPGIESGTMAADATTEVVCRTPQLAGP